MRARLAGLGLALLLAGCTALNLDTAARLRGLDYLHDDIADLRVAFDLPYGLEPVADGQRFSLVVGEGATSHRVEAALARADVDEVAGELPPPRTGRAYFLFGFGAADKAAIRAAQSWGVAQGLSSAEARVTLAPQLCRRGEVNAGRAAVSVLVALPGEGRLAPLIADEPLAEMLASGGGQLPACV